MSASVEVPALDYATAVSRLTAGIAVDEIGIQERPGSRRRVHRTEDTHLTRSGALRSTSTADPLAADAYAASRISSTRSASTASAGVGSPGPAARNWRKKSSPAKPP